jgi:hypothetical protein
MHRKSAYIRRNRWAAGLALAAFAAAATALTATAGSSKPTATPTHGTAAMQRQLVVLRKQNTKLRGYSPAGVAAQLAHTKRALDKYQSVDAAKAAGYAQTGPCAFALAGAGEESSHAGAMGVHYTSNAAIADGKLISTKPEILVYEPTAGGGLQLVAAEYFQPDADQNVKTDPDRPSLFGRAFDGPMVGHAPGMPIHYDLHVWLWKHNPSGTFAPWNPDVSC